MNKILTPEQLRDLDVSKDDRADQSRCLEEKLRANGWQPAEHKDDVNLIINDKGEIRVVE